jgi:hypothetical protein
MPTTAPSTTLRDRLKAIQTDIAAARQQRTAAVQERDAAKEAFAGADLSSAEITASSEFKAAEQAVKNVGELDDKIEDLRIAQHGILEMLGEASPDQPAGNGDGPEVGAAGGWNGHRLLAEGSAYQQAKEQGILTSGHKFGTIVLGEIADRDHMAEFLSAALPAATPGPVGSGDKLGATPADRRGFVSPLLKPLRLLDLIPVGTTDSSSVEYVQITAIPGSAAETAELALKPEQGLTTVDATAPVRTIAGWIKLARQALDDVAGLATLINTLLPYDVRRRIEAQILGGNGVGQNLRGILQTTGIGAPAFVAGDNTADAILRAMTVIILSDGEPNFVTVHPTDWQNLLLMREDNAARTGQYLYGSPGSLAAPTIWGLALTTNRAITATSPLVGDSMGATILVREGVNVKASDSDQDDFTKNRVTVLAEARVAFPVWRPASFAVADTTA